MAAANTERHAELFVGNLPRYTRAVELQTVLAANTVKVVQCRVKKPRDRKPYAFVRVESASDVQTALRTTVYLGSNCLTINQSRSSVSNAAISREEDVCIVPNLESFSLGIYLDGTEKFLERWSWKENRFGYMTSGAPKLTFNTLRRQLHICFATSLYEFQIKYQSRDLLSVVDIPPGHVTPGSPSSALVFAFQCAPQVFKQDLATGTEQTPYIWVRGDIEEERDWRRTTGTFTENEGLLGDYFHYMIVIPHGRNHLADKDQLVKLLREETGAVFYSSTQQQAVTTLHPATTEARFQELSKKLTFRLNFLIKRMIGNGLLYRERLDEEFFSLLQSRGEWKSFRALRHYEIQEMQMETPTTDLKKAFALVDANRDMARAIADDRKRQDESHINIYRVYITPLAVYCHGPELDSPNRVLRKHWSIADRFLRVTFTDENWERLSVGTAERPLEEILKAVENRLSGGLQIGDRHYKFLAMSNSQLRENSCWFFAEGFEGDSWVTAESIRAWMGDFSKEHIVAKYAARMGQCFSCTSTTSKMVVGEDEFDMVDDIKTSGGKYTFSDGIGMISKEFAKEASKSLRMDHGPLPSAFQIRFAGFKGMVALAPPAAMPSHLKLRMRRSMKKFDSKHHHLEVIEAARFLPGNLNRQIILLLSALGIRDKVFVDLQENMIRHLDAMLKDDHAAKIILHDSPLSDPYSPKSVMFRMLQSGFSVKKEPFLQDMFLKMRNHQLRQLREKTHLSTKKAACLKGVLDENAFLEYGQVFVQIRRSEVIERVCGPVVVAKNPCLHPGDVRVLEAIVCPEGHPLQDMVNCVVFPQKGHRPHPDECSGSDLDGDNYYISWEPMLIPSKTVEPMNYEPEPSKEVARVTMDDVIRFFVDYMRNDILGVICNSHLAIADSSELGANDPRCLQLAKLQSTAVDYPKTGHPAKMNRDHHPPTYPDFMEKSDKAAHRSEKIIGKLYQRIKHYQPIDVGHLLSDLSSHFDQGLVVSGYERFVPNALEVKAAYDQELKSIMNRYHVRSEAEAIGGFMINLPPMQRRHSLHDMQAKVRLETSELRRAYYDNFLTLSEDLDEGRRSEFIRQKASAWYVVSYHRHYTNQQGAEQGRRRYRRTPLVSFAWVPLEEICQIKRSGVPQMRLRRR